MVANPAQLPARRSVGDRAMNIATWLLLLGAVAYFVTSLRAKSAARDPVDAPELVGRSVAGLPYGRPYSLDRTDSLLSVHSREGLVIYVFTRACPYCTGQREHVAMLLAALERDVVLTASLDHPDSVAGYWEGTALAGTVPVGFHPGVAAALNLNRVPTIVVTDSSATILAGLSGPVTNWGVREFNNYLRRVRPEGRP